MANSGRTKEQEEIVRDVLGIQPILIGSFFTLLILTSLLLRLLKNPIPNVELHIMHVMFKGELYPKIKFALFERTLKITEFFSLLTILWSSLVGFGLAYLILCNHPQFPTLLFLCEPREKVNVDDCEGSLPLSVCSVCRKLKCQRHRLDVADIDLEPWRNLKLNQAVDTAIQEFLDLLLENYVYHWYREKLSSDERFVDELRRSLRFIFAIIFRRLKKIDLPSLILDKLVMNGLQHLESYLKVRRKMRASNSSDFNDTQALVFKELGQHVHKALYSRSSELQYQRQLSASLLPLLLPSAALGSRSTSGLFRELLVYAVFTAGIDKISEPDFVNQILLVLLDEESMKEPLEPPSEEVEFLANFAKSRGKSPFHALCMTMPTIINTPAILFRFIQFMKSQATLNILQFCLTIEDFNKRCLDPDMTEEKEKELLKEAKTIYNKYFVKGAPDLIPFNKDIVESLKKVINSPSEQTSRLEMATPLYRAYEHVFDLLELTYLPLFHQSDEYFNMICGTRDGDKPTMKPSQRVVKRKLEPLGKKFVNSIKDMLTLPKAQEGAFKIIEVEPSDMVEESTNETSSSGTWFVHTVNIQVTELPTVMVDSGNMGISPDVELTDMMLPMRDMSQWAITIPKVAFNMNGSKEMFSYIISVCESESNDNTNRWDVKRQHHEFYVLQNKLREFHGFVGGIALPPKRNSTLSSKQATEIYEKYRNSFRQYLQNLVRNPLTQGSTLLYNFLSPDKEFTNMFTPDTVGQVAGKKLKSVATMLKKEKGKNLETFLHSFLVSTKPTSGKNSPNSGSPSLPRKEFEVRSSSNGKQEGSAVRDLNKDFTDSLKRRSSKTCQDFTERPKPILELKGVTEYILYFAIHLFQVPAWCLNLLLCFKIVGQKTLDDFLDRYLAYKIRLLQHEYHLVPVIQLFRDAIFFDDDPPRTDTEKVERRDKALQQLLGFFPEPLIKLIGREKFNEGLTCIFELLQHPQLNKQASQCDFIVAKGGHIGVTTGGHIGDFSSVTKRKLAYTLLDTVVIELFPEIQQDDATDEEE